MGCQLSLKQNSFFLLIVKAHLTRAIFLICFSGFSVFAIAKSQLTLTGFFVNGVEVETIDTLVDNQTHYLPIKLLFSHLGVPPTETSTQWQFELPVGNAVIEKSAVTRYQQVDYLPFAALKPLGVTAKFNQQLLAIQLYIPWDNKKPFPNKSHKAIERIAKEPQNIDYYPQAFGLNNLKISGDWSYQHDTVGQAKDTRQMGINIGMTGYLYGGLWGADVYTRYYQPNDNQVTPITINNLYWTRSWNNVAVRIGTNTGGYGQLGGGNYTGVTLGYSNKDINPHLTGYGSSSNSLLGNVSNDHRNIKGRGPAGGIAELRVNGRPIARVRIALDQRYEFIGLNLGQSTTNDYEVEVAVYEYSLAEQPIRIDKPFLAKRQASVATNELLIEAGVGKVGNHLSNNDDKGSAIYSHGYLEYGLTNNIAVRGGLSKQSESTNHQAETHGLVGVNVGLSSHINWDVSHSYQPDVREYDSYLLFDAKYVNASYHYEFSRYQDNIINKPYDKRHTQNLNINIRPSDWLNLQLNGTHIAQNNQETDKYFTAGLYVRPHQNLSVNVHKDRYNDHNYGINWHVPKIRSNFNISDNKDTRGWYVSTELTDNLQVGGSVRYKKSKQENYYHTFMDYRFSEKHKVHAGYNAYQEAKGYELDWQYKPHPYGSVHFGYRKNQSVFDLENTVSSGLSQDQDYFYLHFNFSFFNHPTQGLSSGYQRNSRYGSIITDIQTNNKDESIIFDDKIQLKLNGQGVDAYRIADNQYLIESVKAGVYQLSFPDTDLPLEYQEGNLPQPTIKVANTARTVVPFHLRKTLGVSGQLKTGQQGITITVYQQDKPIKESQSNAFGYYQIIGLPAGEYTLRAPGFHPQRVNLNDDFLFEVNLIPKEKLKEESNDK